MAPVYVTYHKTCRGVSRICKRILCDRTTFALSLKNPHALEKWVRLRNVLAHEYLDIKWKRINDFMHTSEPPIRAFIDAAKKFLEEAPPASM